jgi:acetolactate synthase small subunit
MTIAGTGPKCPKCGKRRKQFVRQGAAHSKYAFESAQYLNPRPKEPISEEVHLVYVLYMQTKRLVDDLNLFASLDDILVHERILKDDCIKRDLALIKVGYDRDSRADILAAVDVYRAKVIDYTSCEMCIEITGDPVKLDAFIQLMVPYGIIEMCRTGIVALDRGSTSLLTK